MIRRALIVLMAVAVCGVLIAFASVVRRGLSARDQPTRLEARLARTVRQLSMPRSARERRNPVAATPEAVKAGMEHFADHCASCHGNDGAGQTEMGRHLFPRAPDMRLQETQALTDGELFHVIEQGVRFTGMPGWGAGTAQDAEDTWKLVHFIRSLPKLRDADLETMRGLNPKSRDEWLEEQEIERFLAGDDEPAAARASGPAHRH